MKKKGTRPCIGLVLALSSLHRRPKNHPHFCSCWGWACYKAKLQNIFDLYVMPTHTTSPTCTVPIRTKAYYAAMTGLCGSYKDKPTSENPMAAAF